MYKCKYKKMTKLNFKGFMKKYNLKNNTMNESQLQNVYNYPVNPRDSKIYSERGFVKIDNGSQNGTHWTAFYVKNNKSYYFDSFGGQPDNVLSNQLSKPIISHKFKIQDIDAKLCGSYCLYFFYLIERMTFYYAISKMYFQTIL